MMQPSSNGAAAQGTSPITVSARERPRKGARRRLMILQACVESSLFGPCHASSKVDDSEAGGGRRPRQPAASRCMQPLPRNGGRPVGCPRWRRLPALIRESRIATAAQGGFEPPSGTSSSTVLQASSASTSTLANTTWIVDTMTPHSADTRHLTTPRKRTPRMLGRLGIRGQCIHELTASVCRDLVDIVNDEPNTSAYPCQGSGTFSVEAAIAHSFPGTAKCWCPTTAPTASASPDAGLPCGREAIFVFFWLAPGKTGIGNKKSSCRPGAKLTPRYAADPAITQRSRKYIGETERANLESLPPRSRLFVASRGPWPHSWTR